MNNKFLVFVYETENKARTDEKYIRSYLKFYYQTRLFNNSITISKICANGKGNLISPKTDRKVTAIKNAYYASNKDSIKKADLDNIFSIIYFADTDERTGANSSESSKILHSLRKNEYAVFSCRDIEEVMLGHQVPDSKKLEESTNFCNGGFKNLNEVKLRTNIKDLRETKSNLLLVFDEILAK